MKACRMMMSHMTIEALPYGKPVQSWLKDRYGETEANHIWEQTQQNYKNYLTDLPDYGGSKNGHARAIYGGLLIFALYPALPDQPPVSELQDFVQNLFMGPFTKLGKIFDLNRPSHMWLIDKVFRTRKGLSTSMLPMTKSIMRHATASHSAPTQNLPKSTDFSIYFRFCATATSSGSARSMGP